MLDPMELRDRAMRNYSAGSLEELIDTSLRYDRETDSVSCDIYTSELTTNSLAILLDYKRIGYAVHIKASDNKIRIIIWYDCSAEDAIK